MGSAARQYFGRCETAHLRACAIGSRGGREARNRLTVGKASMRARHSQTKGYLEYIALPSSVRPKAYVLGSMKKSGDAFVREHQPDDMDIGAARETKYDDVGHERWLSLDESAARTG